MSCKLRLKAPKDHADLMATASAAVDAFLEVGGKLDVIAIAVVKCPQCGTRFTQQGEVIREAAEMVLQ